MPEICREPIQCLSHKDTVDLKQCRRLQIVHYDAYVGKVIEPEIYGIP